MVKKMMLACVALCCALYSLSQHSLRAVINGLHWYDEADTAYYESDKRVIRLEVDFSKESAQAEFEGVWNNYELVDVHRNRETPFFVCYFALYNEDLKEYHGFQVLEVNFNEYWIFKANMGETRYATCNSSVNMDGVPTLIYHDRRQPVYSLQVVEADKANEPLFAAFSLENHNFLTFYEPEGEGLFLANVMPKRNSQSFGQVTYVGERKVNGQHTVLLQWNYHNTYNNESGYTNVELVKLSDGYVRVRIQPGTDDELRLVCRSIGNWDEWLRWLE